MTVSPRYLALTAGAVLVLGMGVYLFFEVRSQPAQAGAPERGAAARAGKEPAGRATSAEEDAAAASAGRPAQESAAAGEETGPVRTGKPIRREPPRGPDGEAQDPAPQKLDAIMAEANKAYDRGDLDDAKAIARRVLETSPNNVRMLRIVVSAACIAGDLAEAQAAYNQLPQPDREQMKTRCARYGATFTEPS